MRITQTTIASNSLFNLQSGLSRMQDLQNKLGTGLEVTKPSDSPERFLTGQQTRSSLARNETYVRTADNAQAILKVTDSALQDAVTRLHRVKQLTIQASNQVHGDTGYKALAREIQALRMGFQEIAETEYAGRKIFAGTADPDSNQKKGVYANYQTGTPATGDKYRFQGNTEPVYRNLGPGIRLDISTSGENVFGVDDPSANPPKKSIFTELDDLAEAVEAGKTDEIRSFLDKLDSRKDSFLDALGAAGTTLNRVDALRARAVSEIAALKQHKSEAESTDLAKTTVEVMTHKVAYEAALNATSRVIQPSLLDFMR